MVMYLEYGTCMDAKDCNYGLKWVENNVSLTRKDRVLEMKVLKPRKHGWWTVGHPGNLLVH